MLAGREGEVFGLYTTTGRGALWMSPALYAAAIMLPPRHHHRGPDRVRHPWHPPRHPDRPDELLPVKPGQGLHRLSLEDAAI
jgi:hypothetical protein